MTLRVILAAVLLIGCEAALARTWTDSASKHKVEAELVDVKDGKVRLKKSDGTAITVPLERLSEADQEWLRHSGPASEWPNWRGPKTDGAAANGPKLLDSWPAGWAGPDLLWRTQKKIPGNVSSPVVADGMVFVWASKWTPAEEATKDFLSLAEEILKTWGYEPDMSGELAKQIDAARVSDKRPKLGSARRVVWWEPVADQEKAADNALKMNPAMDAYIKEFLATLAPKDATKYGTYVKRRFCSVTQREQPDFHDVAVSWAGLAEMWTAVHAKGCKDRREFWKLIFPIAQKDGVGKYQEAMDVRADVLAKWAAEKMDTAVCLDAATGKELWRKEFVAPPDVWKKAAGTAPPNMAASSPAIWNDKCYFAGLSGLYCLSGKDGTQLWHAGGGVTHASILVADGVVVYPGGNSVYDAETGKLLWQGCGSGTASPVLWNSGTNTCVITGNSCFDLHTGKVLWRARWRCGEHTPPSNGDVLIAGDGAYKLTPDKPQLLWKIPQRVLCCTSPVIHQGYVYWFHNFYDDPVWHCLDLKTGEKKWSRKSAIPADTACSSPVLADGKLIHTLGMAHAGTPYLVEMLKATPEKYELLGQFNPEVASMSSPAVADGKLYLRLVDGVGCYDLAHCEPRISKCSGNAITLRLESAIDRDAWKQAKMYGVSGAKITAVELEPNDSHLVRLVTDRTWRTGDKATIKCPALLADKPDQTLEKAFALAPGRPVTAGMLQEYLAGEPRPAASQPGFYGKDDLDKNVKPAAGNKWHVLVNEDGFFDLIPELKNSGGHGMIHLSTHVYSDAARKVQLWCGFTEAAVIYVGGKQVYVSKERRGLEHDRARVENVELAKGWNTILIGVSNDYGGLRFSMRIRDEIGHEPPAGLWYASELPAEP